MQMRKLFLEISYLASIAETVDSIVFLRLPLKLDVLGYQGP